MSEPLDYYDAAIADWEGLPGALSDINAANERLARLGMGPPPEVRAYYQDLEKRVAGMDLREETVRLTHGKVLDTCNQVGGYFDLGDRFSCAGAAQKAGFVVRGLETDIAAGRAPPAGPDLKLNIESLNRDAGSIPKINPLTAGLPGNNYIRSEVYRPPGQ